MKKKISLLFLVTMFTLLFATSVGAATKVTNVKQTGATSSRISISFDTNLGVKYYSVDLSEDGINWFNMDNYATEGTSTLYSGLSAGKTYYLRVAEKGTTAYSDVIKVVTAPEEVQNVVQTGATTSSFTISWDKVEGATSYVIYKKLDGNDYVIGSTTSTSYTVKSLSNSIEVPFNVYVYPVRSSGTYNAIPSYSKGISGYNLKLVPGKVKNVYIDTYYYYINKVYFNCDKQEHADGYEYQLLNYKGKTISNGKCSSGAYNDIANIKEGQFYRIKVRAYATVNNKTIYGEWSDVCAFAQQPKVNIKRSGKNLKLSWKKVKGAKSYTVYVSTSQKSGYKKVATTKKAKYTLKKFKKKKLNKKKTYYIYVVANTKVGGKKFKSNAESCWYLRKY